MVLKSTMQKVDAQACNKWKSVHPGVYVEKCHYNSMHFARV